MARYSSHLVGLYGLNVMLYLLVPCRCENVVSASYHVLSMPFFHKSGAITNRIVVFVSFESAMPLLHSRYVSANESGDQP